MSMVCWAGVLAYANVIVGEEAPNFSLTDIDGQQRSLADYRGKFVILEWINHECPFVRKHYDSGNMQSLQAGFTEKGLVWLSINSSAPGKQGHCSAAEAKELTIQNQANPTAVLLDSEGAVGRLYEAETTPQMFIIAPDGKLIYQGAIDNTPSVDPADITNSENYIVRALKEAMSGEPVTVSSTKSYGCSVKY